MKTMKNYRYGSPDVLQLVELPPPTPGAKEVLIKVHAAALNAADWRILRADPFLVRLMIGLFKPKYTTLGADVAGTVETVGNNVTTLHPGDEVYGDLSSCGRGAFAEYVSVPEEAVVRKPENLGYEQAAAVPLAALTALQALRDHGKLQAGKTVLISGASGGVGTFAVQIAKYFDATVTAVCSTHKMDTVRSLGADEVIDYTKEDFTKNGQCYDLILAVNGYHPLTEYKSSLNPGGVCAIVGGTWKQLREALFKASWMSRGDKKIRVVNAKSSRKDLLFLKELLEAGRITPVIEKSYTLQELPEAMRYLEQGHVRGKLVIRM